MAITKPRTRFETFADHLVEGWKLVGRGIIKWLTYAFYVVGLYIVLGLWIGIAAFVGGFFEELAPGSGLPVGGLAFVLAPAAGSYLRERSQGSSGETDDELEDVAAAPIEADDG